MIPRAEFMAARERQRKLAAGWIDLYRMAASERQKQETQRLPGESFTAWADRVGLEIQWPGKL